MLLFSITLFAHQWSCACNESHIPILPNDRREVDRNCRLNSQLQEFYVPISRYPYCETINIVYVNFCKHERLQQAHALMIRVQQFKFSMAARIIWGSCCSYRTHTLRHVFCDRINHATSTSLLSFLSQLHASSEPVLHFQPGHRFVCFTAYTQKLITQ